MVLSQLIASVLSCTSTIKAFRKNSKTEAFAYDLSLVALSVRSGYLVDIIHVAGGLAESVYCALLNDLRTMSDHFKNVIYVYEPNSDQSFFINKPLLFIRLEGILDRRNSNCHPVFVYLPTNNHPHKLGSIPSPLTEVLKYLQDNLTPNPDSIPEVSLRLPQNLSIVTLVPLAAVLLDYPIAYVPASESQTSFLSGTPLVVYRCHITGRSRASDNEDDIRQHVLLQFSCPGSLASSSDDLVSIERTVSHLEHTFQPRVAQILSESKLEVEYEHVTLDRVAL